MQLLLSAMIAFTRAPLQIAENDVLQHIVNAFLQHGRDHPRLAVGTGEVTLLTYRTRAAMIEAGKRICNARISLSSRCPAVSIAIDAGTIGRSHFWTFCYSHRTPDSGLIKRGVTSRKCEAIFQEYISEESFEKLTIYHQLMYPFNERMQFSRGMM
jgi:hypothetical protein